MGSVLLGLVLLGLKQRSLAVVDPDEQAVVHQLQLRQPLKQVTQRYGGDVRIELLRISM